MFTKFVEVGRLVLITKGPNEGKTALIVEIVDQNRVIIDGGKPELSRQVIHIRHIDLTDIKVDLPQNADSKTVEDCMKQNDIEAQWAQTDRAQMIVKEQIRKNLGDFERFKVMSLQKQKAQILNKNMAEI